MRLLYFFSILFLIQGCSAQLVTRPSKSLKEQTILDIYPVLTDKQLNELKLLEDDKEVNEFLSIFWDECDPSPGTKENEVKEDYYKRLLYANEHFPDEKGWGRSDMKRIYLQYGPPDDIERSDWADNRLSPWKRVKSYEIWIYYEPAKNSFFPTKIDGQFPGMRKFLFVDFHGVRVYKLIYSSEDIYDIDAILDRAM